MMEKEPYRPGLGRNQGLLQQLKEFQRNPRSLVFVALAESYRREGLPHQALDILEEGLAFHPDLASAVLVKVRCLFDLRRYAEALAETKVAIRNNPDNLKAHKLEAEIYVRLGQHKAAVRALTHVVSLYPQVLEAVRALEELENLGAEKSVPVEHLSRASTDAPPPSRGRIEDFQVGSLGSSLAAIGAAPDPTELSPAATAEAEVLAEESRASLAEIQEAAEAEPTFATRTIAELYLRQGLKPKAIKVLRKLLREDPANEWARETLQDLGSGGIVLPTKQAPPPPKRENRLKKRARALEVLLARVRLMKRAGA